MALDAVELGHADAVALGRLCIANPDLAQRLKLNVPRNDPSPQTCDTPGETSYTDYPILDRAD